MREGRRAQPQSDPNVAQKMHLVWFPALLVKTEN